MAQEFYNLRQRYTTDGHEAEQGFAGESEAVADFRSCAIQAHLSRSEGHGFNSSVLYKDRPFRPAAFVLHTVDIAHGVHPPERD